MALPERARIALGNSVQSNKTAFLVKFPQDVWERILAAGGAGDLRVSNAHNKLSLQIASDTVELDSNPLGAATEIYELADSLLPMGTASTRLSTSYTLPSNAKSVETGRATQNTQKHNGLASKVKQQAIPLARTQSSPAGPSSVPATAPVVPIIPLKTRVVQLLALGAASVDEIVGAIGGAEADVMRVVKVIGRQVDENPPRYSLQPSQYSKIKIADWKYTPAEQRRVGKLATAAFDELEIPLDGEERTELERKLKEAAERTVSPPPAPPAQAPPPIAETATIPPPAKPAAVIAVQHRPTNTSDDTSGQGNQPTPATVTKARNTTAKGKGVVAREMAKFRAEQARSSSAPGLKTSNGEASPRISSTHIPTPEKVKEKREKAAKPDPPKNVENAKRAGGKNGAVASKTQPVKRKRDKHPSPDFTSSEEDNEGSVVRGRTKQRTEKPKQVVTEYQTPTQPPGATPNGIQLSFKRKSPPRPLDLAHQNVSTPSASISDRPDDPEEMRDRYEELYPAYQILTAKLIAMYRAADELEIGDVDARAIPEKVDMEKMVKKWERWHRELTNIRRWFGNEQ